jgi:hypothetical protein
MLLRGNQTYLPASEPRISIYVGRNVVLALITGVGVGFHSHKFLNPESRSAKMPAAFLILGAATRAPSIGVNPLSSARGKWGPDDCINSTRSHL